MSNQGFPMLPPIRRSQGFSAVQQSDERNTRPESSQTLQEDLKDYCLPFKSIGVPARKSIINIVDTLATVLCLLCLVAAFLIVTPAYNYAAKLGYTRQIIAIGFLLGVMNQCMLRTVPQVLLLVEARFRKPTLQNLDGILRWTPLASHLDLMWRLAVIGLLLLPLGLSVSYKRFTGGIGYLPIHYDIATFLPSAPPGMEHVASISIMANATVPFIVSSTDDFKLPDFSVGAQAYGFNLLLLSNQSAAAIDAPSMENVNEIQRSLAPDEAVTLNAKMRGTVVNNVPLTDEERADPNFWEIYDKTGTFATNDLYNTYLFGFLGVHSASGDDETLWDDSWAFIGTYLGSDVPVNATHQDELNVFHREASKFVARRHDCHASWNITPTSILLNSGGCEPDPLPKEYQYYQSCQLFLKDFMFSLLKDYLVDFSIGRKESQWLLPTHSVLVASMYQSRIASFGGKIAVQPAGPIDTGWWDFNLSKALPNSPIYYNNDSVPIYNETYNATIEKIIQVPTLRPASTLYLVFAIQPMLTLAAFIGICLLHHVPVGRGFGLVSVLAGVEKESLSLLAGATLSGKTKKPVDLEIKVVQELSEYGFEQSQQRLQYTVGGHGCKNLSSGIKYY